MKSILIGAGAALILSGGFALAECNYGASAETTTGTTIFMASDPSGMIIEDGLLGLAIAIALIDEGQLFDQEIGLTISSVVDENAFPREAPLLMVVEADSIDPRAILDALTVVVELDSGTAIPDAIDVVVAYGGPGDLDDDMFPVSNSGGQIDLAMGESGVLLYDKAAIGDQGADTFDLASTQLGELPISDIGDGETAV